MAPSASKAGNRAGHKATNKTVPTGASVEAYIASRASAAQAADCATLGQMLQRVTGWPGRMWGPSIVGHGTYRYTDASGRTGEMCLAGYAVRGRELVLYLMAEGPAQQALLDRLGPHRRGKSCLYVKRLDELDLGVLEQLAAGSVARVRREHQEVEDAGQA